MKKRQKLVTDEQWELIEPLLPEPRRRKDNRGRPWASNRACFEGILWILQTGAAWRFLPDEFPSPGTCWRRLKQWQDEGVWLDAWRALLGALDAEGLLKWDETFPDGSFAPAKKGRCGRQNQARQGNEVDGTGRRSRSSAGSSAGKCLSFRSYACGGHARTSPGPASERPATAKAEARNRAVPPTSGSSRTSALHLLRLLLSRLLLDYSSQMFMKHVLNHRPQIYIGKESSHALSKRLRRT